MIWPVSARGWNGASRPPPVRAVAAPGARTSHRSRGGEGARGVGAHRAPRPRGLVAGRGAGVLAAGPQRRLATHRRGPNRSERVDGGRGEGTVPGRGAVI